MNNVNKLCYIYYYFVWHNVRTSECFTSPLDHIARYHKFIFTVHSTIVEQQSLYTIGTKENTLICWESERPKLF